MHQAQITSTGSDRMLPNHYTLMGSMPIRSPAMPDTLMSHTYLRMNSPKKTIKKKRTPKIFSIKFLLPLIRFRYVINSLCPRSTCSNAISTSSSILITNSS
mmetsp:Transcript_116397/g.202417  ORF Transcript_116397/g.202417 Transcript_116397/m.202417 type:complete len:101 (-) Transcript_116397:715-1017(-)